MSRRHNRRKYGFTPVSESYERIRNAVYRLQNNKFDFATCIPGNVHRDELRRLQTMKRID